MKATIYHNPRCGTSRSALDILRDAGIEPKIVEYLQTPLSRKELEALAGKLGGASHLLREREPLADELKLKGAADGAILDAIAEHPILFNRPVVETEKGAKVCRPAEVTRELI